MARLLWYEPADGEVVRITLPSGVVRHEVVVWYHRPMGFIVVTEWRGTQYARWRWQVEPRQV